MQENHTVYSWFSEKERKDNDMPRETALKYILSQEWNSLGSEMSGSNKTSLPVLNSATKDLKRWILVCPSFVQAFYLMNEAISQLEEQWKNNGKGEGAEERKKGNLFLLRANTVMYLGTLDHM